MATRRRSTFLKATSSMPQFGLGGNGSEHSHNRPSASIIFGWAAIRTGRSHVIALGGANGNGNVTQINIAVVQHLQPADEPLRQQHEQQHDRSATSRSATATAATATSATGGSELGSFIAAERPGTATRLSWRSSRGTSSTRSSACSVTTRAITRRSPTLLRATATGATPTRRRVASLGPRCSA